MRVPGLRAATVGIVFVVGASVAVAAGPTLGGLPSSGAAASAVTPSSALTPIRQVVVIFQENHSFDNVLGRLCVADHLRCDGATSGVIHTGKRIPLSVAHDIVAQVDHKVPIQAAAINHGKMNGFDLNHDCAAHTHYRCYTQYAASGIPNLSNLAEKYVISDRTFSENPVPSWGGHIDLIAGQLDGFEGVGPTSNASVAPGPGWGCNSNRDTPWRDPTKPLSDYIMVPSCIPRPDGYGPYRPSPVKNVPTILDRLDAAGLSWKLYTETTTTDKGYLWSICPTFASCLYDTNNYDLPNPNWTTQAAFLADAAAGTLPAYSAVLPSYRMSQHNSASMLVGDNYIQSLVSAVMNGRQWQSTAIFITYDDCGCFYDHVPPPAGSGLGIRVPMVIISPQAKAAYVDHTVASFDSMLAFVEQNWELPPLTTADAHAYDYCHSFVFTNLPCTGPATNTPNVTAAAAPTHVQLRLSPVPRASINYTATHPADPNDPT